MVLSQEEATNTPQALAGVRVVDFTWVRAGPWATRWLATLGAEVIKVEWPGNPDGAREYRFDHAPGLEPNLNTSGLFSETNANKLSITLNVRSPKGLNLVKRLISMSDMVVENFSSRVMGSWGLGYEEMCKLKADIIYLSISGFGHTGRHRHYTTMGPSAQALSGMTYLSGLPDQPPAGWGWSYLDDASGMYGAMCALAALHHRNVTGRGQHADQSQMITGVTLNGPAFLDYTVNGRSSRRAGYPPGNRTHWPGTALVNNYRGPTTAPHNSYRTRPGGYNDWCVIVCFSDEEWRRLLHLMGSPRWAADPKFATLAGRLQHQEELDQGIESWTQTLGKYEVAERCQEARVRAMPVQSGQDRVEYDPQLRHRGMFKELEHPVLGFKKLHNAPFKMSETPAVNYLPGPLIGQHNREVLEGLLGLTHRELLEGYEDGTFWPPHVSMEPYPYIQEALDKESLIYPPRPTPSRGPEVATSATAEGPLAGLKVLELADEKGQYCGKLLGDLGADVIKIEPPGGEATRTVGPFLDDLPHRERSLSFWHYNTSKRAVTLNLETEDGRGLFRRLASTADVILETFPPGYLASLGLGYEELKELNPRLILCSLTPFGQAGPWRDYVTSDLLHLAAGGQMASCGYREEDVPDAPPIAPGGGQAWHMGSYYAHMAIMAAVCYRDVTGRGQYIDASVHEACVLTTETTVPIYIYAGQVVRRLTGQGASHINRPRIQLACKGGRHMNAQIERGLTPQRVKVLAEWMASYGLEGDLLDEKYQDQAVIQENLSHIKELVVDFFSNLTQEELYHAGQERRFNFGPVRMPDELVDDPHLRDQEFWKEVEHPELGRRFTYPGPAAILNGSPWRISRRAPLIGEHNLEVFGRELGLSKGQLALLAEAGVV